MGRAQGQQHANSGFDRVFGAARGTGSAAREARDHAVCIQDFLASRAGTSTDWESVNVTTKFAQSNSHFVLCYRGVPLASNSKGLVYLARNTEVDDVPEVHELQKHLANSGRLHGFTNPASLANQLRTAGK